MVMRVQRHEQRQRYLKAKVALAPYRAYGRVPRENEIDEVYYITRILKRVLGTPFLRKHYKPTGQLALF
jgi:hypothetical protein